MEAEDGAVGGRVSWEVVLRWAMAVNTGYKAGGVVFLALVTLTFREMLFGIALHWNGLDWIA